MTSMLLTHGYVVTVDPERHVIPDGWIHVENDRITGLGSMQDLGERTAGQQIDLHGMATLPGFINGHNHHWASLFKNTGEGLLLEPWLDQVTLPLMSKLANPDLRIAAYLGAIEQIKTGTTCSLNHVVNVNDEASMAAIIEPALAPQDHQPLFCRHALAIDQGI
jgi:5-methylthioadenosine/S-adenosylhomocysteine deaminase